MHLLEHLIGKVVFNYILIYLQEALSIKYSHVQDDFRRCSSSFSFPRYFPHMFCPYKCIVIHVQHAIDAVNLLSFD